MRKPFLLCFIIPLLLPSAALRAEPMAPDSVRHDAVAPAPAPDQAAGPSVKTSLDGLIREAVAGNPRVQARLAAKDAAGAGVSAAFWQLFPSPYVQLDQGSGKLSGTSYKRLEVYGVRQPVWTGGKLWAGLKVAKGNERSTAFSVDEARLELAREVVGVYRELLSSHYRIRSYRQGVALMERFSAIMERRVGSGVSGRIDQTQVDARLFQARNDLALSQSAREVALEELRQLVGRSVGEEEIVYFGAEEMTEPPSPDMLLAQAERASPTLARLAVEIETGQQERKLERSALFPALSLKAEHRNYLYANDSRSHENILYASLEYSFGSGLSTMAKIRSSTANIERSEQTLEAARRELRLRVASDVEECSRSLRLYRYALQASTASADVLASYTRLFVAGKRSWLDVLNAARELTQNEVAKGDIIATYWATRYRLRLHAMDAGLLGDGTPGKP